MSIVETVHVGSHRTIVEAVTRALIRHIAAEGLNGGDRLPSERQLVDMLGVSRLPLREALSVLKGMGIVEAQHGKGLFVKRLDLPTVFGMLSPLLRSQSNIDLDHLFQARMHLEGSVAELAAVNRDSENLDTLDRATQNMRENLSDRQIYIHHDMAFHQELARSTRNSIFHVFMASITDLLVELQFMYEDRIEVRHIAVLEHEAILDDVRRQRGPEAKRAMCKHLQNATRRVGREPTV